MRILQTRSVGVFWKTVIVAHLHTCFDRAQFHPFLSPAFQAPEDKGRGQVSQDQCHCVHEESQLKRLAIQDSKARNLLLPCIAVLFASRGGGG